MRMNNNINDIMNESRIIFIDDVIDAKMANYVVMKLMYFDALNNDDITIYINSLGGSVADGLAIIDAMYLVKSKVNTIGYGTVASMAAIILASGEKRSCMKHTRCMIHQVFGGMQGTVSDVEIAYNNMLEIKDELMNLLACKVKKSRKQVEKDCDRDYWLSAVKAKEYGLIDEVL